MIQFKNVSMTYPSGVNALDNVTLNIEKGEFVFVVGASGAGKSTLIKMLLRELVPTKGKVTVNGYDLKNMKRREIPAFRRTIGVVFQDFRLIPTMTVFGNVAFALQVTGVSEKYIRRRVPYILDLLGLAGKARSYPGELSGGEQQRASVARALAKNPKVLFLDEPTGALDEQTGRQVLDYICRLHKEYGFTIVMVTHNQNIAEMANTVVKMNSGKLSEAYTNEKQKTAYEIGW